MKNASSFIFAFFFVLFTNFYVKMLQRFLSSIKSCGNSYFLWDLSFSTIVIVTINCDSSFVGSVFYCVALSLLFSSFNISYLFISSFFLASSTSSLGISLFSFFTSSVSSFFFFLFYFCFHFLFFLYLYFLLLLALVCLFYILIFIFFYFFIRLNFFYFLDTHLINYI